jgi:hypothetical protein
MLNALSKLTNLGGFLNGSKTYLGLASVVYYVLTLVKPEWVPFVNQILQLAGVSLLPIGLADKARKALS